MVLPPDKIDELRKRFQTEEGVRSYFRDIRASTSDSIRQIEIEMKNHPEVRQLGKSSIVNITQLAHVYDLLEVLALNQISKEVHK